jgi:hypothetical protein
VHAKTSYLNIARWSIILLLLAFVTHYCQVKLDNIIASRTDTSENEIFPNPNVLHLAALGYDQILADCYWLGFIQYYGDSKARLADKYGRCYDYLNLVTSLDPHFLQAYWFAAFAVGSEQKRPDLAAKIITAGINANQNDWSLPYIAAVNYFINTKDDKQAAKYYRLAAKFPGAPPWLNRQAQVLEANLPRLFKEIRTWSTVYESNPAGLVRATARGKLIALWRYVYQHTPNKPEVAKQLAKLGAKP